MSGYIGPLPVPQGIQRKQSFTATAGQTTFNTNGYTDGNFITVYLNGVRLINGTDYTATNGSDVVLTTAAAASDVLDFETFQTFSLVDQTFDNVTLKNPTHEDTDGGRESAVSFKGEQSGGEISTLAQIQASHDGTSDDQKGDLIFKTNDGSDNDAPTEAMRVDSSQHVLIGKTSTSSASTVDGIMGLNDGRVFATTSVTTSTEAPFMSARTSTAGNGKFIDFKYNGTSVGDISVDSSDNIQFGATTSGGAGFYLHGSGGTDPFVLPMKEGALSDNTVTLGDSARRYKDLYLSGGAYIGGTGASNKLEDYEEGTWTPALENQSGTSLITPTTANGSYVKIGNSVQLSLYMSGGTLSGSASQVRIVNLPFVAESGVFVAAAVWPFSGFTALSSGETIIVRNSAGSSYLAIQKTDGGTSADVTNADFGGSLNFSVQISYETV